jgi:glycosyltransferase involved in cell wall biosynthesis
MLSFIIPAYNEELVVGRTIQSIHDAARSLRVPYEIVVADDASTDRTAEIAQANRARVVRVSHRQIAATRNAGARTATGDQFIFVDADTIVSEGAVRSAHDAMTSGAAGGGCALRFDGRIPPRFWPLRMMLPVMMLLARPKPWGGGVASGCFIFCTRDVFQRTGGFDESLFVGEEISMSRAIRRCGRFVFIRDPEHAVTTSGRKLRAHSAREIYGLTLRMALGGRKFLKKRENFEIWYNQRRNDPDAQP